MEGGTLPVTLIVKAPNQQIEDQTIKCELSWTINKLKQHLQEVYPSRPPKHEQKLIYSGQLLSDSVMLKDVLRQYDGQETHTVHLVCSSSRTGQTRQKQQPSSSVAAPRETVEEREEEGRVPQMMENGNTVDDQRIPPAWTNAGNFDANRYAMHMAWMQQAYMQYMTQQYAALSATREGTTQEFLLRPQQNVFPQNAPPQEVQREAPDVPQPQQQQQPAPAVRDPDHPERDWLDHFYVVSRIMVLFSIVYFYSSPLRFVFVVLLGFGLYLYQIGFFWNINVNNNNNNIDPAEQVAEENPAPSRLMVAWTFFTTFFASLIPEIPNAI